MVELRKRKAPSQAPITEKKSKKEQEQEPKGPDTTTTASGSLDKIVPNVGDTIALDEFGGKIETNEGAKTTLKELVSASESGVVLFTYPKASTPGCKFSLCSCLWFWIGTRVPNSFNVETYFFPYLKGTKQACLFRDSYDHLKSTGLSIYGLSADSPKANTTFKSKQNLPYPLLCDTRATLIGAIGFQKVPKGTTRGVFGVDKQGNVLLRQAGGPDATVNAVQELLAADPTEETTSQSKDGNSGE